jgi:hypothetical protein
MQAPIDTRPSSGEGARFVPFTGVRRRYGNRSRMWVQRLLASDPTFPKPFFVRGQRLWRVDELEAWEASLPREQSERTVALARRARALKGAPKAEERARESAKPELYVQR